jgi:hypothetical protein
MGKVPRKVSVGSRGGVGKVTSRGHSWEEGAEYRAAQATQADETEIEMEAQVARRYSHAATHCAPLHSACLCRLLRMAGSAPPAQHCRPN